MVHRELDAKGGKALQQVLGYLNFSSGATDLQFLANINWLFGEVASRHEDRPPWRVLGDILREELESLRTQSAAFADARQAAAVLQLLTQNVLPGYLAFHRDLLFHQTDRDLFGPFFIGRACEAVVRQGPPWDDAPRITAGSITLLNDYLGHRPVATLETQRIEPYAHEWVRPIPLFIRGAGVACGPEQQVVQLAIKLLEETDEDLLRSAYFDPQLLDELAVDPRAYDFDHPVNKRPNYHFGQWDPHQIDNQGRYRRFVVQQVTLEALMQRLTETTDLPQAELEFEAAAVLAGTILMASGISGSGPGTHDSTVTLTSLLPNIASYRDVFYERLFQRTTGEHADRLRQEAAERRQPFGGARQHLNSQLARRRASQLEHVHLAKIFARMGYPDAAATQANVVPVASARMLCSIDCRLTASHQAINQANLEHAAGLLPEIIDLLKRAIHCGAVIDPWNILGFDAHFSLFPAVENSIRDYRADELLDLMEQIFACYSRLWSEAAARDDQSLSQRIGDQFQETSNWWRQFAVHAVPSVDGVDASEVYLAARHVAGALNLWHKGGAAAGDIAFWASHAEMFDSPKAYALVIDALLLRGDFVASMALLIHWLGQAERVGLEQGDSSFHQLAEQWLAQLNAAGRDPECKALAPSDAARLQRKFFDYLEANAENYWKVPQFELGTANNRNASDQLFHAGAADEDEDDDDDDNVDLFSAAYENVVYHDSTDDGVEGPIFDPGAPTEDELERESERISDRLAFLSTLARLWKQAAVSPLNRGLSSATTDGSSMHHWVEQAADNRVQLMRLLDEVRAYQLPASFGDHESMIQYDRQRLVKESLLERIIATCVETAAAVRLLLSAASSATGAKSETECHVFKSLDEDQRHIVGVFSAVLHRDVAILHERWDDLRTSLLERPLLYVPLAKGGDPREIVGARIRQQALQDLLACLPRLGLLTETRQLIDAAREMELNHPIGPGAVTEFDELFKIGYKALVESLVNASKSWQIADNDEEDEEDEEDENDAPDSPDAALVSVLERLTESLLVSWLAHSRTLRLSVLEKVKEARAWDELVKFIERYGNELFTQKFFNLGNVRAILHQGVDAWLQQLEEDSRGGTPQHLLDDLDHALPRDRAVRHLSLVLEAIIENYGEYRDYNSTTTQSDRGELLYMLLDFLRLRSRYDRIAWNLRPVVWAHEILVRGGLADAAKMWRRSLADRIGAEADKYLKKLKDLQKKYSMRMPTVADRLGERFVRPMQIDRIRALVEPAIRGAGEAEPPPEFEILVHETNALTREPSGVGLDVPTWLIAVEEEVENARRPSHQRHEATRQVLIEPLPLDLEEASRQLDQWQQGEVD